MCICLPTIQLPRLGSQLKKLCNAEMGALREWMAQFGVLYSSAGNPTHPGVMLWSVTDGCAGKGYTYIRSRHLISIHCGGWGRLLIREKLWWVHLSNRPKWVRESEESGERPGIFYVLHCALRVLRARNTHVVCVGRREQERKSQKITRK